MIEAIRSALLIGAPGRTTDDAPARVAEGKVAIRIVYAESSRAEAFDQKDPRARIVKREKDGWSIRLRRIEFQWKSTGAPVSNSPNAAR